MEDDSVSELDEECDVTIAKETELMKMERSRKQAERRQSMLVR